MRILHYDQTIEFILHKDRFLKKKQLFLVKLHNELGQKVYKTRGKLHIFLHSNVKLE